MMMYNQETKEIAKPSELLNSIKSVMSVLQSIENYGKIINWLANYCKIKWIRSKILKYFDKN